MLYYTSCDGQKQNSLKICEQKNFENRPAEAHVIIKNLEALFF